MKIKFDNIVENKKEEENFYVFADKLNELIFELEKA